MRFVPVKEGPKGPVPPTDPSLYRVFSGGVPGYVSTVDIPVHPAMPALIDRILRKSTYKSSGVARFAAESAGGYLTRNTRHGDTMHGHVKWAYQYPDTYKIFQGFLVEAWRHFSAAFPVASAEMERAVREAYGANPAPLPGTGWTNFHIGVGGCRMHTDRENAGPVTNWTVAGSNLLVIDNLRAGGRRVAVEQAAGRATVFDGNLLRHAGSASPGRVVISLYASAKQLRHAARPVSAGDWPVSE